jgi:hypothetical protein
MLGAAGNGAGSVYSGIGDPAMAPRGPSCHRPRAGYLASVDPP